MDVDMAAKAGTVVKLRRLKSELQHAAAANAKTPRGSRWGPRGVWFCSLTSGVGWRDLRKPADGMRSGFVFGPMKRPAR